ncbi:MAG TPA: 16S rRNA (guanine(527)-N(7))-methyltransferase RsmG [Sedimentisphaerales bacterium]|nr:16S rRNA (guanine(527)-N(7))-methyltransferase RsmG [Sedimentisphaerales bacterium]
MKETASILAGLGPEKNSQFEDFARMIEEGNKIHNLTRVTGLEQIRIRHFEDSLAALPELERLAEGKGLRIIDVGSGAGLPGLAIAIARPQWRVTSLDGTGKKVRFQQDVIRQLGLKNAEAIHGRAEELARDGGWRGKFDAALARALGDLAKVAKLALPLVRAGGEALAWKGPAAENEIENARETIGRMAGEIDRLPYRLEIDGQQRQYTIVVIRR